MGEEQTAYASAIDAYAKTQAATERASEVRKENLAAIDVALARLQWLQSVQLKLDLLPQQEVHK